MQVTSALLLLVDSKLVAIDSLIFSVTERLFLFIFFFLFKIQCLFITS